jgi:hypothetical protein
LFDLKNDPQEKNNLVATPEGTPQVELLSRELERLKQEAGFRLNTSG